jgi:hypothetical protein
MDAYDRCTNLEKSLADIVAIYGRGREIFTPFTYMHQEDKISLILWKISTYF